MYSCHAVSHLLKFYNPCLSSPVNIALAAHSSHLGTSDNALIPSSHLRSTESYILWVGPRPQNFLKGLQMTLMDSRVKTTVLA